tara:strand:+ start:1638 stop:1859 length:222 start_codon:yes stop_codon:yes gene_type:complete
VPPFTFSTPFSVIKLFVLFHFELASLYCNTEPSFKDVKSMSDNELKPVKAAADGTVTETFLGPDVVVLILAVV